MAKLVKEITSGNQLTLSGGPTSQTSGSATRVFRIILDQPGEVVSAQDLCGIGIGSAHPNLTDSFCTSVETRYDGESRMALLCTFQYDAETTQSGDNNNDKEPGTRPANWSTSTSLIETPVYSWYRRTDTAKWAGQTPAVNAAGDIYDAVTKLTGILNINVVQEHVDENPVQFNEWAGFVNSKSFVLGGGNGGGIVINENTCLFKGVNSQPFVEEWNGKKYKGWRATFELAYKPNRTEVFLPDKGQVVMVNLGWDVAVPESGFNVRAFTPPGRADQDQYGQPLKHADGMIGFDNGDPVLPMNIADGEKVRAMVRVFDYERGGVSQAPSASPIPLNDDGTPRSRTANPQVLVYGYQVQGSVDFVDQFKLRFE